MQFTAKTRRCLKCEISPLLTRRGGRTDGRIYLRKILPEPKFPGCIGNQIFLPMVLHQKKKKHPSYITEFKSPPGS